MAAAELFPHHAFVDLETTGLDPACDRVIEVGVLFIHQGKPVEQISKLFCAGGPLPLTIQRLTGIDDADLAGQPAFEDFLPKLRASLAGWTVVAHNASFERGFLANLLAEIRAPVLDSCELLHYLYPELASYSLDSLIRWAGVGERAAHRALRDCQDTFAMLFGALERCIEEQRDEEVAEVLESLAPSGDRSQASACPSDPIVALLSSLVDCCRNGSTVNARGCPPTSLRVLAPAAHPLGPLSLGSTASVASVVAALEHPSISAIELGPRSPQACAQGAVHFAKRKGCRVSLSVGSDSRLASLLGTELPALGDGTESLRYSLLDEQRRYFCRRRALQVSRTDPAMSHEERAPRAYLRAFLRRSPTGETARLSHWFHRRYPLLERLASLARSEPATTLGTCCPHYRACFYHSALSAANDADLLVTRHRALAEWPQNYPRSRYLVIDEAHQLEGALSAGLARELSGELLRHLEDRLIGVGGHGGLLRALEPELEPGAALGVAATCQRICLLSERMGAALAALMPPARDPLHRRELLLSAPLLGSPRWDVPGAVLRDVKEALSNLAGQISRLGEALPEDLRHDLDGAVVQVRQIILAAAEFESPASDEHCRVASTDASGLTWKLRSEPLQVCEAFGQLAAQRSVVLTSSALSLGAGSWILDRLGVSAPVQRVMPAPAHWRGQIFLIEDAPRPFDEEFLPWASSRLRGIATFLNGRTMGVFSSQARLAQIEDRLGPTLESAGIETARASRLLREGRRASSAGRLLLGGRAVWHQRRLPGELVCIFIDKLPVEPLSRPSVAAREALASRQCSDARYSTMPYRLPTALVLLRQWLSSCAELETEDLVIILAYPGAPQHRGAVAEALDGYEPALLPWSVARRRIHEALTPFAAPLTESRPIRRSAQG